MFSLRVCLCVLLASGAVLASGGRGWNKEVSSLIDLPAAKFTDFVSPVVEIAANAYRYPRVKSIPGWRPAAGVDPLAPPVAGCHALVYEEVSSGRLVLAFRGTDLDSLADECADLDFFGGGPSGISFPNATQCKNYSQEQLDYFTQAVAYAKRLVEVYPHAPLLLSGHSLGAALAIMVSAALSSSSKQIPAVVFGSPGMRGVLKARGLSIAAVERKRLLVSIGDEWDFVSRSNWGQLVGIVCSYEREEPADCVECWSQLHNHPGEAIQACETCFEETHFMYHVLQLVASGEKPSCLEAESYRESSSNRAKAASSKGRFPVQVGLLAI